MTYNPIIITVEIIEEEEALNDFEIILNPTKTERIGITEYQADELCNKLSQALQERANQRTQAAIEAAYGPTPEEIHSYDYL